MAMDEIDLGTGVAESGDTGRAGGDKINKNFIALVQALMGVEIWSSGTSEDIDLNVLTTTDKTSIKAAINELVERTKLIDDSSTASLFKTWSVTQILASLAQLASSNEFIGDQTIIGIEIDDSDDSDDARAKLIISVNSNDDEAEREVIQFGRKQGNRYNSIYSKNASSGSNLSFRVHDGNGYDNKSQSTVLELKGDDSSAVVHGNLYERFKIFKIADFDEYEPSDPGAVMSPKLSDEMRFIELDTQYIDTLRIPNGLSNRVWELFVIDSDTDSSSSDPVVVAAAFNANVDIEDVDVYNTPPDTETAEASIKQIALNRYARLLRRSDDGAGTDEYLLIKY